MRYALTAPSVFEPVDLHEAKGHLRIDDQDIDDERILGWIQTAREEAEALSGRVLCESTWTAHLDTFPAAGEIRLTLRPVSSVSSIRYVDGGGALQTMDPESYALDASGVTPRILLAYGASWPWARAEPNAVRIEFVAGSPSPAEVPARYRSWILTRVGDLYAHREGTVVGTIAARVPFVDSLVLSDRLGF